VRKHSENMVVVQEFGSKEKIVHIEDLYPRGCGEIR
jgi:hypothetical protein